MKVDEGEENKGSEGEKTPGRQGFETPFAHPSYDQVLIETHLVRLFFRCVFFGLIFMCFFYISNDYRSNYGPKGEGWV